MSDLRAAAEAVLSWLDEEQASAHFEAEAEAFWRATGIMAPGKSVPLAMGPCWWTDEEQREAWRQWIRERRAAVVSALRAALAAGPGEDGDVTVSCEALGVWGSGPTLEAAARDMLSTATRLRENYADDPPERLHSSAQEHLARLNRWHPPAPAAGECCGEIGGHATTCEHSLFYAGPKASPYHEHASPPPAAGTAPGTERCGYVSGERCCKDAGHGGLHAFDVPGCRAGERSTP